VRLTAILLLLADMSLQVACGGPVPTPAQELTTAGVDAGRSGWASAASALSADRFDARAFGVRFRVRLAGSVLGQPLVSGGDVFVATDQDIAYRLDGATGTVKWQQSVGRAEPAGPGAPFDCADVAPSLGVLSTPVVDSGARRLYLVARNWDGRDPATGTWVAHSLSLDTGAEAPGWPVPLAGLESNGGGGRLEAAGLLQRPALLLFRGRIWVAFGGACDRFPFRGWLASVAVNDRAVGLWTLSPGDPAGGAGVWQSGGGLALDDAGQALLASGDANPAHPPGVGSLAQCVLRLDLVGPTPEVSDRFCPAGAADLNRLDLDLGTGNPLPLPTGYGGHPGRLVVQVSKDGRLYLLDRDRLANPLAVSNGHEPMLSRPAAWPGAGLVFVTGTAMRLPERPPPPEARLRAYRVRAGPPATLEAVASSDETLPYGSGSPLVTSDGTRTASALVWVVARQDPESNGQAELRAYEGTPADSALRLRFLASIGSAPKFGQPGTDGKHIYVSTADGFVLGFGLAGQ